MHNPMADREFDDWGEIPEMVAGVSSTFGKLLHRNPDGGSECGIWNCTPGTWNCHVTSDEFCHFVAGRCRYTAEDGDIIEVKPGTMAFFPEGWRGSCEVIETVRKVYMIR